MKKKYILEYPINSSIKILFPRLSTSSGLSEWFANEVTEQIIDKAPVFKFRWDETIQYAKIINLKDLQSIKFKWNDDDLENKNSYFEFAVSQDELTGEVLLTITDFAEINELDDNKELWEVQISDLKRLLGN